MKKAISIQDRENNKLFHLVRYLPLFLLTTSYELITDYSFVNHKHPIHFDGEYRQVAPAKFRSHSVKDTHNKYKDAHGFLYYSHFLTPDNSLSWKVGYSFLDFDWKENPRFSGSAYNFASASLGWVSTSIPDWRWVLSTGASVDANSWNMGQTGVYYGLMWGRYQFAPTIGMHIGWAGYVGVKNGYLLPILGIDWRTGKHWKFNGIFPLNLSVEYLFNSAWSTELQASSFGRPYRFPMRAKGGVEGFKNGIFEVYSKGLELDFKWQNKGLILASLGGGWNFGGWILIKDHHNHHGAYYKYDGAPYAQGKLELTF